MRSGRRLKIAQMQDAARQARRSACSKALQRIDAEAKKPEQLRRGVSSVELNQLAKIFESLGLVEE